MSEKERAGKPPIRSPYCTFASTDPFRRPGFWLLKVEIASLLGARKVKLLLLASKAVVLGEALTKLFKELSCSVLCSTSRRVIADPCETSAASKQKQCFRNNFIFSSSEGREKEKRRKALTRQLRFRRLEMLL